MVDQEFLWTLQAVSAVATALGVCIAAAYYVMTLRTNEKIRKRDIVYQSNIARSNSEWFQIYFKILDMWDYDTLDEYSNKFAEEKQWGHIYIVNQFNMVGIQIMEGIASSNDVLKLYPSHLVINLFEMSWPWIRDMRSITTNMDYLKGFEALYYEAKKRLPNYIPSWQRGLRSSRSIHP